MALREYKCECGLTFERIIPTEQTPPEELACPKCGGMAPYEKFSRTSLLTGNFSEQKVDVTIGLDAERRWQDINDRQANRDSVRRNAGQQGLSMVGRNEFVPLTPVQKAERASLHTSMEKSGVKHTSDNPTDKKILGN